MLLFLGCFMSQQHHSVSQGRICSDNCTCCHTEIEVSHQTFYLKQSQHTDTRPTSPRADPITPGAWQGSPWSANFLVADLTRPGKIPTAQAGIEPWICRSRGGRLNHKAKEAVKGRGKQHDKRQEQEAVEDEEDVHEEECTEEPKHFYRDVIKIPVVLLLLL